VSVGQPASFDASASSDADGSIVSYHWNFGDGQVQDSSAPTTSHTYGSTGSKTVTLTITDGTGATAQVTHRLSVVSQSGRCVVPRLLGKKVRGAHKLLGRHGCRLGKVRHKHVYGHKRGRIVRQALKPGTIRQAGSAVGVTVAR
jgi:hypothetical protein